MIKIDNISEVASFGLCKGCGTCVHICKTKCISFYEDEDRGVYKVKLVDDLCAKCGKCLHVCPAYNLDLNQEDCFGVRKDPMLGQVFESWTGFSTTAETRFNGSSGGAVTEIIKYIFEQKIASCALVAGNTDDPFHPMPKVVSSIEELCSSAGSKYIPLPLNSAIDELKRLDDEKIVVIGLPCHITGLRRIAEKDKKLQGRIVFYLGLFCGQTPCFYATRYSLKVRGINEKDVSSIQYRGKGWPGKMTVKLHDGKDITISYRDKYAMGSILSSIYFTPSHCLFCNDSTAQMADMSFADAWLEEFKDDKLGRSLIIARNNKAFMLMKRIIQDKRLEVEHVGISTIKKMHKKILCESKLSSIVRRNILTVLTRKKLFENDARLIETSALIKIKAVLLFPIIRLIYKYKVASKVMNLPFNFVFLSKFLGKLR